MHKNPPKIWPNEETAGSAENISAMKQNLNIHNVVPAISSRVVSRMSLRLSTHAREITPEELGAISKNNREGLSQLEDLHRDSLSYLDTLLPGDVPTAWTT